MRYSTDEDLLPSTSDDLSICELLHPPSGSGLHEHIRALDACNRVKQSSLVILGSDILMPKPWFNTSRLMTFNMRPSPENHQRDALP